MEDREISQGTRDIPQFHNLFLIPLCYAILTLVSGLVLIFFDNNPARNDQGAHWNRILMLGRAEWFPTHNPVRPSQVGAYIHGSFVPLNNTAINSPFVYWPSLLAGGDRRLACVYTLLACTAMIALGIWLARRFQLLIFAAAILPMTFLSIIYFTADAVTNAYSLLFIGLVLHLVQRKSLRIQDWIVLTVASVLLGQIKITCVLLVGTVLLLAKKLRGLSKLWLAVPIAGACISNMLWNMNFSGIVPAQGPVTQSHYEVLRDQAFSHPLDVLRSVLVTTFAPLDASTERISGLPVNPDRWLQIFTGAQHTQLQPIVAIPLLIAVVLMALYTASVIRISVGQRWYIAGIVVVYYLLTTVALLLAWSGNIGGYITGAQSRYFIPILPLIGLLAPRIVAVERRRAFTICCAACIAVTYAGLIVAHVVDWSAFPAPLSL